ncbi:M14 family zinc carboxypeptidase [Planctomycetota bacterium]
MIRKVTNVLVSALALAGLFWFSPLAKAGDSVPDSTPGTVFYSPGAKAVKVTQTSKKSGEISVTLTISPPLLKEITARDGKSYIQLNLAGFGNENKVGRATLPIINHVVEVPWGTKAAVQSVARHYKSFSVKRRLYPYQPPIPKVPGPAGNPPFELNELFYSGSESDSFLRAAGADKARVQTFRKRGHQYAKVSISPFEYNPVQGLVRYPSEVELKVSYTHQLPKAAGPRAGVISIVEVLISDREELNDLIKAGYNISNVKRDVVTIYATQQEVQSLRDAGYKPEEIDRQRLSKLEEKAGSKGLGLYHNYTTLTADLQAYAADYNDICRLSSLGKSVQGREIWAMKITDNPEQEEDEPEFKYVSTMHGDEPVGTEMCLYFIDLLLTSYDSEPNITDMVDSTEIWIVPLMNPDGLELGTRFNADGYDLNRSFPEGSSDDYMDIFGGPYNNTEGRPTEVAHLMRWSQAQSFVLSANLHTGSLVVNYPYDNDGLGNVDSPTPDDALFEDIARRYSYYNPPMWNSSTFTDGITNGAAWYVVSGGMQDWNYRYISDNEVIIELSDVKTPPESELPDFWADNKDSMLAYLEAVHMGIRGIVTDTVSGKPIWADIRVEGVDHPVFSDPNVGDYYRMLLPGTYNLVVTAPGYKRTTIAGVNVLDGETTRVDVALEPAQGTIITVTYESLAAGAAEYVAQKEGEGYDVHLITLTGTPSAEEVRSQIRGLYTSTYADFVVIIGDIENVPTFYGYGDASDLLYGLMDPGESFDDYLGREMVVGRICLDTNAEISDYVSKLAGFVESERNEDLTWISGGSDDWQNDISEQTHDWVIEYCILPEVHNEKFYRSTGSAAELTEHINNGTDAVVYSGHGSSSGWMRYDYDLADLEQLTNTNDTPIVFGHCCLTASFQENNCFAENWIKTTERGIVYIGASNSTYWIEDDVMEKAEFQAMRMDNGISIAGAIDYGLERVDDMCPSEAQYYYTIYQVIGDPTVRLFKVPCPELGQLRLDSSAYSCSDLIEIELLDCSPNEPAIVDVNSTSEPAGEKVTLTETESGSGRFTGSILTEGGTPSPDGLIQVNHGDTLVITYQDPNDGTGSPAVVLKTAAVDCVAPVITNVTTDNIGPQTAVITFETNDPACGIVRYGASCGELTKTATGGCAQMSHSVNLSGLEPETRYLFAVDAEDTAGNETTDDNSGVCYNFTTTAQGDYFTELFDAADNDLDNISVTFTPDGSPDFYSVCIKPATSFPTDPAGGTVLSLDDDDCKTVLSSDATVSLYGHSYGDGGEGVVAAGSNGYLIFGGCDTDYTETLDDHFDMPRVSALFDDLNPSSGGLVSRKRLSNRLVVTWENVPEYAFPNQNSFQIEMFFDGKIRITWLGIAATDGIVGLSEGGGIPEYFQESNLSGYGPCLVDFRHFAGFAEQWYWTGLNLEADLSGDGDVDEEDLALFVEQWLDYYPDDWLLK